MGLTTKKEFIFNNLSEKEQFNILSKVLELTTDPTAPAKQRLRWKECHDSSVFSGVAGMGIHNKRTRDANGNNKPVGTVCKKTGYTKVSFRGNKIPEHTIVMILSGKAKPTGQNSIDHIDRDRSNNSPENLREATPKEQAMNRATSVKSKIAGLGTSPKTPKYPTKNERVIFHEIKLTGPKGENIRARKTYDRLIARDCTGNLTERVYTDLDPVTVVKNKGILYLADGYTRIMAYRQAIEWGERTDESIPATIIEMNDESKVADFCLKLSQMDASKHKQGWEKSDRLQALWEHIKTTTTLPNDPLKKPTIKGGYNEAKSRFGVGQGVITKLLQVKTKHLLALAEWKIGDDLPDDLPLCYWEALNRGNAEKKGVTLAKYEDNDRMYRDAVVLAAEKARNTEDFLPAIKDIEHAKSFIIKVLGEITFNAVVQAESSFENMDEIAKKAVNTQEYRTFMEQKRMSEKLDRNLFH